MGKTAIFVAAVFLGLFALRYANYLYTRLSLARNFGHLAKQWHGSFHKGSFFSPPKILFPLAQAEGELSAFYVYRGKTGNHTQLRFRLPRTYLRAFSIHFRAGQDYDIVSTEKESIEDLLQKSWSSKLEALQKGLPRDKSEDWDASIQIDFDGSSLTIKIEGLLCKEEELEAFKELGSLFFEAVFDNLDRALSTEF